MEQKKTKSAYQFLMLIATPKLTDKAADMFLKNSMPILYRLNAEGTASSEIMETLGLGGVDKNILVSTVPRAYGNAILGKLHSELRLDAVNSGIAFTISLTGASKLVVDMMEQTSEATKDNFKRKGGNTVTKSNYALIIATVDRGFSGEVMDAARSAGAGGGTVVHSRSVQGEEAPALGLGVTEEKEMVLILAEKENKTAIMRAISENCGVNTKAKGTVISLPTDSVMGI